MVWILLSLAPKWEAYLFDSSEPDSHSRPKTMILARNPYKLTSDILIRHGSIVIDLPDRSFSGIQSYLKNHTIEGIVFWKDGEPQCKIKRSDFGFKWPV